MRIIFIINFIGYCCIYFVNTSRMRENFNVLVPNNDANFHEKIKNLLNENNVDPKELSDEEIAKLAMIKKVLHRNKFHTNDIISNKINDLVEPSLLYEKLTTTEKDLPAELESQSFSKPINFVDVPPSHPHSRMTPLPEPNPSMHEECILGKSNDNLEWVDEFGKLKTEYIEKSHQMKNLKKSDHSYEFQGAIDFRNFPKDDFILLSFKDLEVLSLAFNNFNQLPAVLLNQSINTLLYLSLAGNDFKYLDSQMPSINLSNLVQLDLRKCGLRTVWENFFKLLDSLEHLYLSYNNIMTLYDFSFNIPHLLTLDLSYNEEQGLVEDLPNRLRISEFAFAFMKKLQNLDLSHTKLELKSVTSLTRLSHSVIGMSLCYTDLTFLGDKFLSNLNKMKFLDVSGNTQFNFTRIIFSDLSRTLERLDARDSNVRNLDWTRPLMNLRALNLKDNKIRIIDNSSFSHMLYLEDLNLEKNSIGNWFSRLFTQNQNLMTLNLRENTLTQLSTEMVDDLLSVRRLAIGKNEFECSCSLQEFMQILFEATKRAGNEPVVEVTTLQSILFGARNDRPEFDIIRPEFETEYDVMSRVYQRYTDQVLRSIEALRKNNYKSKSLISSLNARSSSLQTVLLDYDANNEDYQCMNITEKQRQLLLELNEQCDSNAEKKSTYMTMSKVVIMTLSTSIPTVLITSLLLFLLYWKWWYIRYFFVLCKNSAILTFMDDYDGGKETIVRRKSNNSSASVDIFLYDIFVSYSDLNRDWVLNELIPNIEKRESINVCLHERDFQIGFGILENIVSCMDRSRCLLLLISKNFLQSQWCQFEMNLAQHRLLETRRENLIMVLLEDIPVKKQPKILKYLMRTKTYIKWPNQGSESEKQLFWKRLKKSIVYGKWENENYGSTA